MKKSLCSLVKKNSGRNNRGVITVRHRGGGHRRQYRYINFNFIFLRIPGIIYKIKYDPNRNCQIGLVLHRNGLLNYIIGYNGMSVGDILNERSNLVSGNTLFLKDIPIGSLIYNVELKPGFGGQIARAAGSYCQIISKNAHGLGLVLIKFKSKEEYLLNEFCKGTLGVVSNVDFNLKKLYKAGQNRWLGKRPSVRGVAMNPVDHPHGGGEGKTSGGRPSVSFKGVITKGKPTRKKNKLNKFIIKSRKKK